MTLSRTAFWLLLSTGAATAQTVSSPPSGAPGNLGIAREHPFFFPGRYQYVLGDVTGTPRQITGLRLVADETLAPAAAQTVTVTLQLGHARTTQFAALDTTDPDQNVIGATTVLDRVTLSLPATTPGLQIPILAGAAFAYDGSRGLVVEFTTQRTPATDWYGLDGARGSATLEFGVNDRIGLGCSVPPNVPRFHSHGAFAASTDGSTTSLPHAASYGPINQPGVLVLGLRDLNTNLGGGLCDTLRPSPDVLLPVATDGAGQIATLAVPMLVRLPSTALPLTLYTQFAIADPARREPIGVAVSSTRVWTLPAAPSITRRYVVAGTPTPFTKSVLNVPVMLFQ